MRIYLVVASLCLVHPMAALAASEICPPAPVVHADPEKWNITAQPPGKGSDAGHQALVASLSGIAPPDVPGDGAALCRYRGANDAMQAPGTRVRLVLMGDSITEFWGYAEPGFFTKGTIDRGISGQVTWQMLVRFRQDVIDLHPATVAILGGTNDLNGPPVSATLANIENNIQSMAELARTNHIAVVLGTVPPMGVPFDTSEKRTQIAALNDWIRHFAQRNKFTVADYHAALQDPNGTLDRALSIDPLHPNRRGYLAMQGVLVAAVR